MDYKKIIRSRAARENILRALAFIPDEAMLRIQYRIKTGRALHLKHPTRFTEKLQWYKLYYRDPDMLRCVDKYEVRAYLRERGFQDLLPRCFGVFDSPDLLPVSQLPDRPENFGEMVRLAEAISAPFPHVRVDLYNVDGLIRFGELTFFNASGYMLYEPDCFDREIGDRFSLPQRRERPGGGAS